MSMPAQGASSMNMKLTSHSSCVASPVMTQDLQKSWTWAVYILLRSSITSQWPSLMHRSRHHFAVSSIAIFFSAGDTESLLS